LALELLAADIREMERPQAPERHPAIMVVPVALPETARWQAPRRLPAAVRERARLERRNQDKTLRRM
jgi:hypothetical protein